MGIFDESNYIVNPGITELVFPCTAKVILLAKIIIEVKGVTALIDYHASFITVSYCFCGVSQLT